MGPTGLGRAASAPVLIEALAYLRRFRGAVVVVKHGGAALASDGREALSAFAQDIALLAMVGVRPVVVHGGGPQIGALMQRLGMEPEFVDGLRVTDAATLDVARMVLVGKVNREVVGAINAQGSLAVGISGEDAGLVQARPHPGRLGFVGEVTGVQPALLQHLLGQGLVPVVATIGADAEGQSYNINADAVAAAIAGALGAEKLLFLTDVDGIRLVADDANSRISSMGVERLQELLDDGTVRGGMRPKALAVIAALRAGVGAAHVLDGRLPHAMLVELLSEQGIGTMVHQGSPPSQGAAGPVAPAAWPAAFPEHAPWRDHRAAERAPDSEEIERK